MDFWSQYLPVWLLWHEIAGASSQRTDGQK